MIDDGEAHARYLAYDMSKHHEPPTTLEQALEIVRQQISDDVLAARTAMQLYMTYGVIGDADLQYWQDTHRILYFFPAEGNEATGQDAVYLIYCNKADLARIEQERPGTKYWEAIINTPDDLLRDRKAIP